MLFFKRQLTSVDVSFPHYFTQLIIGPLFLAWRTNIFIYFFMTCSPLMWGLNLLFFLFSFLPMNWKILLELSSLLQSTSNLSWATLPSLNFDYSSLLFSIATCHLPIGPSQCPKFTQNKRYKYKTKPFLSLWKSLAFKRDCPQIKSKSKNKTMGLVMWYVMGKNLE